MGKKSTSPVRIETLQKHHDRTRFDCGTESLNQYLKQLAKQEQQRRTAAVFVLVREDDPQVLGYYTLSQSSVLLSELPASRHKKLPRYPQVPTTLLGRLAVDRSCRGLRYGELLLMNALERAWTASQQVASFAMIVDVLEVEPDPMPFYLRYDFEALPTQSRRLFLPLQVCDQLFAAPTEKKPDSKKTSAPAPTAPKEKTWKETRWGIDPNDPLAAEAFQKGQQLADEQAAWLQELPGDRLIDEVFEREYLRKGVRMDMVAFRFGFKSQMEKRFPYRY